MHSEEENCFGCKKAIKTMKYFYKQAIDYKPGYFILIIGSILVSSITPFINILFPKYIIDELLGDKNTNRIIQLVAFIVIGNMICNMLKNAIDENLGKYADSFERYFNIKISRKSIEMDFEHTENSDVLNQAQKAETGMSWYSGGIDGLTKCFVSIISSIITLTGVTVVIVTKSSLLLLVIAITIGITTILNAKKNAIQVKAFQGLVALNRAFGYIFWQLSNFKYGKDIRLYGADDMMMQKAKDNNEETTRVWKKQALSTLPYNEIDSVITAIRDGITYFYLGYKAIKRVISIGDFTMLSSAASTFSESLTSMIFNVQEIHKKLQFMNEYMVFMNYENSLVRGEEKVKKKDEYEFQFVHVSFKYPRSEDYVLKDINLTIKSGEHLSVVGLNGAGKTTFIKLLCRLYEVSEGEILLNGVNIKEYDYEEYMKIFSVVFQDFKLLSFSIKENVALGHSLQDTDEKVTEHLKLSGLSDKVATLEKGIETSIYKQFEEDGIEPSGGEAQKLAIARALYKNAPIIILDEPTAALDPIAEYEIYNHFDQLVGKKTAVYISHRLSSCKFCDRIIVFGEGTVAESGTHEELLNKQGGIYSKMFNAQAQYYVNV
ncbi:ABC transporter ATP-binding protein [Anaeromicropila herbilytica]|uniref:ABC transporter ATP-binding protein n=1 Tax=Anaeromicropila herbilytica TaxID=2785025 RepID=A0A7R7EM58_9FIRM|nr:ABC transporter ATP-binding protein [Anaeromicropila herbilytica]BCN31374.1 ABC transporter ATP-binding protein [Anaeromicropila herbilytica]